MAGRYAQQRLYVGGDPGSLLLRKRGTDADPRPASEEYDGVFEDLTGNRANDHKVNELRFSNNFVEKRSSSFLKALRNQDILLTEWWSMNQPNRVNYKFHDVFKSGS